MSEAPSTTAAGWVWPDCGSPLALAVDRERLGEDLVRDRPTRQPGVTEIVPAACGRGLRRPPTASR